MDRRELIEIMKKETQTLKGHVGMYVQGIEHGDEIEVINGTDIDSSNDCNNCKLGDVFKSASVIKIWIMATAFDQIEKGKLDRSSIVTLKNSDKVPFACAENYAADLKTGNLTEDMFPESGVLNCMHDGLQLTVEDVIKLMILISDNTATNMLIDVIGIETINEFIASKGADKSRLSRRMFDTGNGNQGLENVISLRETGAFFRELYSGEMVSKSASFEMSSILQNQQITYKIPFFLRDTPIAHKTGEDTGIANDVGLIFADKPFIFCFASNDTDVPKAEHFCQEMALSVYEYYNVN